MSLFIIERWAMRTLAELTAKAVVDKLLNGPPLTTAEKHKALEALGWKFERYSRRRKRWVPMRAYRLRRFQRAVDHAWANEKLDV